jgi:hypothetical protein
MKNLWNIPAGIQTSVNSSTTSHFPEWYAAVSQVSYNEFW